MNLQPAWIALVGFMLISFASEALVDWHLSGERPMLFDNLGILGDLLDLATTLIVVIGGLSLVVWSFANLSWYLPILFYAGSMVLVKVVSAPFIVRIYVTSALTPLLCAVGIVALHWLTWFA